MAEAGVDRSARADLLAGGPAGLAERSVEYVRARIGRVLGVRPDRVDPGVPLTELGLDSLLAVELMTALKTEVGVELPVVRLLQGISVAELGALVAADLPVEAGPGQAPPPVEARAADAELRSEPVPVPAAPPAVGLNGAGDVYRALDYARWKRSQRTMKALIRGGFAAGARVRVEGLEHLPAEGGFLLAANHLSMADVPLLLTVMPRPAIVYATEELRAWPWLHWFLSDLGNAIYVRRGTGDERSLELGLTVLGAGGILALGPEGRRSATGALERGETGVAFLASRGDVPVVPVAAWGQERLGVNWRRLSRAPVQIRFGPPVPPPGSSAGPAELRAFTDRVMEEIARLLPLEYRGVYADVVEAVT